MADLRGGGAAPPHPRQGHPSERAAPLVPASGRPPTFSDPPTPPPAVAARRSDQASQQTLLTRILTVPVLPFVALWYAGKAVGRGLGRAVDALGRALLVVFPP